MGITDQRGGGGAGDPATTARSILNQAILLEVNAEAGGSIPANRTRWVDGIAWKNPNPEGGAAIVVPADTGTASMEAAGFELDEGSAKRRFIDFTINSAFTITESLVSDNSGRLGVSSSAPATVTLDPDLPADAELLIVNNSSGSVIVVGTGEDIDLDPTGIDLNAQGFVVLQHSGNEWLVVLRDQSGMSSGGGGGTTYSATDGLELVGSTFREIPYNLLPTA